MLALTFAHPWLLYALPLAAVPIVIHLLNRRRYQRQPWAAMAFLLKAAEKNRRRTNFEHWLVLLLRTLAVVLLVLLCARPRFGSAAFTGERTHHVIVVDDSASMDHRDGAATVFERCVRHTLDRIRFLCEEREGDLLTLVLAGTLDEPLLAGARAQDDLPARARDLLVGKEAGDGSLDLKAVLETAHGIGTSAPEASRAEIHLLTDLCQVDWLDEEGRPDEALRALLPLPSPLHVIVAGIRDSENLAVVRIRPAGRLHVVGVPIRFDVDVRNHGLVTSESVEVTFEVDGLSRTSRVIDSLAAGETSTVSFLHAFGTAGPHAVTATLAPDRMTKDDRRAAVFEVKPRTEALIVDGRFGATAVDTASYYLGAALDPAGDTPSGIHVTVVSEDRLATTDLQHFDMIFLCDLPAPASGVVQALEQQVQQGTGLVIFPGSRSDGEAWNLVAWRAGQGLLPAPFTATLDPLDPPAGVVVVQPDHPLLATARAPVLTLLSRGALVSRHVQIDSSPPSTAQVLMRVAEPAGPPFVVEGVFGEGRVVLFAVGADTRWSRWPITPPFLVLMQDLYRYAARSETDEGKDLIPSETLRVPLDLTRDRPEVVVRSLAEPTAEWTFAVQADAPDGPHVVVSMAALEGLGTFEVRKTSLTGATTQQLFARNVPLMEGRLQKTSPRILRAAYGEESFRNITFVTAGALEGGGRDLLKHAALVLLGLLVLESFLAMRVRRR